MSVRSRKRASSNQELNDSYDHLHSFYSPSKRHSPEKQQDDRMTYQMDPIYPETFGNEICFE